MKEVFKLEKPQMVAHAVEAKKGLHLALEILIFIAVYWVSTLGQTILLIPAVIVLLLTSGDFRKLILSAQSSSMEEYVQEIDAITSNNGIMIASLLVTIATTLIVMGFCKWIQKRKMNTLGFHKKGWVKEYLIGWLVGFVVFSAAVLICVITGSLTIGGISPNFVMGTFLLFTIGFIVQGMSEEVLCRGYFMVSIGRRYSMWVAVIVNSVAFAILHLGNSGISILAFVNLVLFGMFASVYFIKRNDIWGICAVHSVWNLVQGNVYNIRVSGMKISCSVFSSEITEGKELINGGAFGLEGGLAVTIVLVAGILILLCMKSKKQEECSVEA